MPLKMAVVGNQGAKAACEVAYVDLRARGLGETFHATLLSYGAYGACPRITPVDELTTDLTIAADQAASVVADRTQDGFRHLKVKVGLDSGDVERVCRIHDAAPVPVSIRIDANQGWDQETTLRAVDTWTRAGVSLEFIEQPLDRWDLAGHAALRAKLMSTSGVRLMLDESVFNSHDLDRVIDLGAADLINIKLAKCGGLTAGLRLAATARSAGLGVMVGSMMESAVGVSAAAALALIVNPGMTHDLDSAWWTIDHGSDKASDTGRYRGNRLLLPAGPGLSQVTHQLAEPTIGPTWTTHPAGPPR